MELISKFVDAGKLGGWVRAGVGAVIVWAIAQWPALNDIVGDQATQTEIAVAVSAVVVGAWSHFAKSAAPAPQTQAQVLNQAKKAAPLVLLFLVAALGGCSTDVANKVISAANAYDNAVLNFTHAADAVNGSIALTSATVGPYCSAAQTAGKNLVKLASGNDKATTALNTTAAALTAYCVALPTDIQGAIVALTNAAVAAKAAAKS